MQKLISLKKNVKYGSYIQDYGTVNNLTFFLNDHIIFIINKQTCKTESQQAAQQTVWEQLDIIEKQKQKISKLSSTVSEFQKNEWIKPYFIKIILRNFKLLKIFWLWFFFHFIILHLDFQKGLYLLYRFRI